MAQPGNVLAEIVAKRRESIAHRERVLPLVALKIAVEKKAPEPRDFWAALNRPGGSIIAELKKASPSRGILREDFRPAALAAELESAGAAALSVLTEEEFFLGSLSFLKEARAASKIPVLRKDFILNSWQVWESRAAGADSFLLIAALLSDAVLGELLALGRQLGMEPLVEVHTREELARAIECGAGIIGANNRDLKSFAVRLETALELAELIPENCTAVAESGIHARADLERLRDAGFDAFLIGEQLMRRDSPGAALRELIAEEGSGKREKRS
jgi:indole-3-glycerol phosphate synthase